MKLFLKLAWRNMLRNKRRTLLAGLAIGVGLASVIFVDALYVGMERYMVRAATASFMGEAQIHRQGFRDTYDVDLTISHLDSVVAGLRSEPDVEAFAVRAIAFAMVSSPSHVNAVSLVGVQPEAERKLSQIDDAIRDGTYFTGDNPRDIVIGSKLAELLEVGIGDRLVLTASQAHSGDLSQELFRVSGIYHFNVRDLDEGFAFVRLPRAQQMLGLGTDAHEIAVNFTTPELAQEPSLPFWKRYSRWGNEALSWTKLLPQLDTILSLTDFNILITGLLLFGIVALGIVNVLFMSLYERMFEFGVLRAVGTRPWQLLRLMVLEAASLSLISMVLGMLIGLGVTLWVGHVGIDYRGIEFAGVTLRDRIYPVVQAKQYITYPLWVFGLTTLVGLYPAAHAARIVPARAMRRSF